MLFIPLSHFVNEYRECYRRTLLKNRPILSVLLATILLGGTAYAQRTRTRIYAQFIKDPITIDGAIEESVWAEAPNSGDLIHIPYEGEDFFYEQTEIKLLYDNDFLYVAFICRDSDISRIQRNVKQRDADLRYDDSVYVLLSIQSDIRNFYLFGTNSLGTRADAQVSRDGLNFNPMWNADWQAAAKLLSGGWSVEMAIRLSSLGSLGETKTIGMSFSRLVPRLATSFWRGPIDPIFNFDTLQELQPVPLSMLSKRISINPYFQASSGESGLVGGASATYTFSQQAGASLTIFPDFLTVEEDPEFINLTRFELRYPEKRDFFQSAEIYDTDIPIFYSKRIGEVTSGMNFEAETGGFVFSGMSVLEKKSETLSGASANFSVLQVQRQTGNLYFRALASNRFMDGSNMGAAGMDGNLKISETLSIKGQFFASYGKESSGNLALSLRPSYDSETFHFHIALRHMGENFGDNVNVIGFIQDDNRREVDTGLAKTFLFSKGALKRISLSSNFNIFWGTDGILRSWLVEEGFLLESRNKFSIGLNHQEEYKTYEQAFRNSLTRFTIGFNLSEQWQRVGMAISAGKSFNRRFNLFELFKKFKLSQSFFLEYDLAMINFDEADWKIPGARDSWIHMIRAQLEMSSRISAKMFFTFRNLRRLPQKLEEASQKRTSLLLQITWLALPPRGVVQIGYKNTETEFGIPRLQPDEGLAFIRLSYSF